MKKQILFFVLLVALGFSSCAPTRYVQPLAKKQQAVTANFGGPMIGFAGAVIPIPLSAVGYGYGIDSNTTVYGNLHTTSLLYGVIQTDIGVCRRLYTRNGFGISANVSGMFAVDKWEGNFRAWPLVDLNAWKNYGTHGNFVYAGVGNWFELSKLRAHGEPQPTHWIFDPHIGITFCKPKWHYQIESRWLAPNIYNLPNVVDYKAPGHHGAIGLYFGVYRLF